jgi:6-phosphogluconate dehydrogenase
LRYSTLQKHLKTKIIACSLFRLIVLKLECFTHLGKYLLPKIRDTAGQKGTGKWTAIAALNYGMPVTLIGEAVFSRCLSALKNERQKASQALPGPSKKFSGDIKTFLEDIRQVLLQKL